MLPFFQRNQHRKRQLTKCSKCFGIHILINILVLKVRDDSNLKWKIKVKKKNLYILDAYKLNKSVVFFDPPKKQT